MGNFGIFPSPRTFIVLEVFPKPIYKENVPEISEVGKNVSL